MITLEFGRRQLVEEEEIMGRKFFMVVVVVMMVMMMMTILETLMKGMREKKVDYSEGVFSYKRLKKFVFVLMLCWSQSCICPYNVSLLAVL